VKFQKSIALISLALSVTSSGYHAVTRESVQDIRWSMQGYRKKLVGAVTAEASMLNMLQRLIRFSSKFLLSIGTSWKEIYSWPAAGETVDDALRRSVENVTSEKMTTEKVTTEKVTKEKDLVWPHQEILLFRFEIFLRQLHVVSPISQQTYSRESVLIGPAKRGVKWVISFVLLPVLPTA
jgi:hypothetical protein